MMISLICSLDPDFSKKVLEEETFTPTITKDMRNKMMMTMQDIKDNREDLEVSKTSGYLFYNFYL